MHTLYVILMLIEGINMLTAMYMHSLILTMMLWNERTGKWKSHSTLWPHGLQRQAPLSLGFPRQESWSGYCYFLPQEIFPTQVSNPRSLCEQADFFFTTEPPGKTKVFGRVNLKSSHHTQTHIRVCEVLEVLANLLVVTIPQYRHESGHHFVHLALTQPCINFSSVQPLSRVWLFATPWTAAHQASLSITNSRSLLKLMSIESVMPSNHLILCCPLLLLPSIFSSFRVFSNESALRIRWPKYWSFSFNISPSNEYSGLISLRMDWLGLFAVQGTLKSSPTTQFNSSTLSFLYSPTLTSIHDHWKNHNFD